MYAKELDLNKLEMVSGGLNVREEVAVLKSEILKNPHLIGLWNECMDNPMNEGEDWWIVADVLDRQWGICMGMGGRNENDGNCYDYGKYSFKKVLNMVKNFNA